MRKYLAGLLLIALAFFLFKLLQPGETPLPATPPATTATQSPAQAPSPPADSGGTAVPAAASLPSAVSSPPRTAALFKKAFEPKVFELASGAIAAWREFAPHKPTLVLFSLHPFLDPLSDAERQSVRRFTQSAAPAELVRRSRLNVADTIYLPPQTVSVAIEAGLLGELVFVQPTTREKDKVSLVEFQKRAYEAGFLTEQEALALKLKDGVISGTVRGLPFRCVHPDSLPRIDRSVIVHVDLGYFMDVYLNDVKTPLYNLLYQTARDIRDAGWATVAATLSYSNQEAEFSLETRFLISNLATLLLHPELLEGNTPPTWKLRADARFARAMFAETTADELTAQAVEVAPDDPDALYALAQQKFIQQQPDEAFALIDRAVAHDQGYAIAYKDLAETALEKGRDDVAEKLLKKAIRSFPSNPFLRIDLAHFLIRHNRGQEAIPMLRELQQLPWSIPHHPGIPTVLEEMLKVASEQTAKA